MTKSSLTGSRIRQQRIQLGVRQGVLANSVGISAPYLNLIEHNKRKIAGKLLNDIARQLEVEPSSLSHGVDANLLASLSDAAKAIGQFRRGPMTEDAEDLAGRFPGWADVIAGQRERIETLERTVASLGDRMTHDPQLASSLHEVLSVVTAIRSTSAILAQGEEVDAEWQSRFHRNMYEDSQRLAQSAQALVEYLDTGDATTPDDPVSLPQEDLAAWLADRDFHVEALEVQGPVDLPAVLARETALNSSSVTAALAAAYLERYLSDARRIPLAALEKEILAGPIDPIALSFRFSCDLACVFRRLACLPVHMTEQRFGLVTCDNSGTLTFRKPISGFALPKFGAACPVWPLYQALTRPMSPIKAIVEQAGYRAMRFTAYAVSQPQSVGDFNQPTQFEATMLISHAEPQTGTADAGLLAIGPGCRICPREDCSVRREPSILTQGF